MGPRCFKSRFDQYLSLALIGCSLSAVGGKVGHDGSRQLFSDRNLARRAHRRNPRAAFPGPRRHALRDPGISSGSLYRRVFAVRREFSQKETDYFLDIDFVNHVALVAVANDAGPPTIVGGGRYVVVQPGQAEVAFAILDAYKGQGIGSALMRHLATLGREAGLHEFIAEVLSENAPMLNVFERSGLTVSAKHDGTVMHVTLGFA